MSGERLSDKLKTFISTCEDAQTRGLHFLQLILAHDDQIRRIDSHIRGIDEELKEIRAENKLSAEDRIQTKKSLELIIQRQEILLDKDKISTKRKTVIINTLAVCGTITILAIIFGADPVQKARDHLFGKSIIKTEISE